jgi:hypothetical protein
VAVVSFRYHLVSLAGVLLALAAGIVLGSAALAPAAAPRTVAPPTQLGTSTADEFALAVGPRLVKDALAGRTVLVLLTSDAPPVARKDLVAQLRLAGATVSGQVRLRPDLFDPSSAATLDRVAAGVVPGGVTLPQTSPLDRVATELAATLVTSNRGINGSASARGRVLGAFTAADLLTVEGGAPTTAADLVVLLAGPTKGVEVAAVAAAFAQRVGTVVAAPLSATDGSGVLAVLRQQGGEASDVDGVNTPQGLVATVLALVEQAAGRSGHYGSGTGARAAVPALP